MIAAKVANALALDYPRERLRGHRRLRRLHRRHRRARPGGRRRPRPRPAARRQGRRPERRRRARRAARSSPSPTPTASGSRTRCAHLVEPLRRPGRRLRLRPGPLHRRRAATTSRAPTGATRWRCGEMESALAGVTAGNGGDLRGAPRRLHPARRPPAATTSPSPSRWPSAACARSTCPGRAAEEKMVPTLEGEFARKRRMMVGLWDIVVGEGMLSPARLPAALRLRDRLAPAAALPDPVPAPARASRPTSPCSATAGSTSVDPRRSSWRCSPRRCSAAAAAAGAAADRPLLRDDHRLDRRRALGPAARRGRRAPGRRPRGPR